MTVVGHMCAAALSGAFTFYNIMPWNEGREEESARDMVEYVERTGNPICLYSLPMHAEGRPATTRAMRMIKSYRKVRRLVEGTPVKLGVLLQSTLGHWSRVDREIEPWQRTVRIDGTEARFCPLDPGFQNYIREVVRLLAAEKPVMIMGDVDIRGYSGGRLECFCPLHVAEFNKAAGTSLTSEQLRKSVADGKEGEPILEAFVKLHRKTVCDFAAAHNKPVVVTEGGSDKNGASGEAAAAALTAKMFSTLNMVYPQVKAVLLFDRSIKEAGTTRDFSMQSSGTYQKAILEATKNNPALISSSEKTAAEWIPAEAFSERADEVTIGATGYTYWDNELTVTYSFAGKTQKTSASPNLFTIKAADIKAGRNDLTVTFTGKKGFKLTKTYVVRRSASGAITISSGVYPFTDLNLAKWCVPYVEAAYDTGLVKGVSATKYGTKNDLQIAQAVTLAARIYAEANGEEAPSSKGSPWYKPAYDYCVEKGIIDPALLPMSRLTEKCTRFEMVEILDKAIPASRWDDSVKIADGYIPDLRLSDEHGELVYRWYRAGIVGGDNTHRFNGGKLITRAEVAKILCTINRLM